MSRLLAALVRITGSLRNSLVRRHKRPDGLWSGIEANLYAQVSCLPRGIYWSNGPTSYGNYRSWRSYWELAVILKQYRAITANQNLQLPIKPKFLTQSHIFKNENVCDIKFCNIIPFLLCYVFNVKPLAILKLNWESLCLFDLLI